MTVGEAKLTKKLVRRIKLRIVAGESLSALAAEHGVGYMAMYKIAIGENWKQVKPRGRLIGKRDYQRTRRLPLAKCEAIALVKIRRKLSNAKIASHLKMSESTVRRAIEYGNAALGLRLHQYKVRGTLKRELRKMRILDKDVEDLILASKSAPEWVRRAVEGSDANA